MIFRFFEIGYDLESEALDYDKSTGICWYTEEKNYNELYKVLQLSKEYSNPIELKNNWYNIEDIILRYDGGEEYVFVIDVYCSVYF